MHYSYNLSFKQFTATMTNTIQDLSKGFIAPKPWRKKTGLRGYMDEYGQLFNQCYIQWSTHAHLFQLRRLLIVRPLCILPTTCPLSSPYSTSMINAIQDLSKGFIASACWRKNIGFWSFTEWLWSTFNQLNSVISSRQYMLIYIPLRWLLILRSMLYSSCYICCHPPPW